MRFTILFTLFAALATTASADTDVEKAAKSATDAKTSADAAAQSATDAGKSAGDASKAAEDMKALAAVGVPPPAPAPPIGANKNDPPFDTVQILGDANLAAGSLTGDDNKTVATGAAGIFASTDKYSLLAAFTFGSVGPTTDTTREDYISFLRTPSSAVGAQIQLRALYPLDGYQWLRFGPALNLKANGTKFKAGTVEQEIGMVQIDGSVALSVKLDKDKKDLFFVAEAGLGLRFWNKPSKAFLDAIDIGSDSHVSFGPRVVAAVTIGRIHVGVELTRFWGGDLEPFKEFSVLPYVGIDGGLEVVTPKKDAAAGVAPGAALGQPSATYIPAVPLR